MQPAGGHEGEAWAQLLRLQEGAASRQQALAHGWTPGRIDVQLRSGRWRRLYPGVFVTFTGPLPWKTQVWAALLHAGPDAVASHRTAARLASLVDGDPAPIEGLVPWGHGVTPQHGPVVRSSRYLDVLTHPARTPPQTRVGTGAQVATVLASRGWPGSARPCGKGCSRISRAA